MKTSDYENMLAEKHEQQVADAITEQAIDTVARQLVANGAREIQWEGTPGIGAFDWERVADRCLKLTPEPKGFDAAITLLEERADEWTREGMGKR